MAACWRLAGEKRQARTAASACPEPNPRLEVTSTEVNLFVWTEYIPQHTIDCFEEVYGITVNKDEYSSNEEMYAKLSAGGANYDLVQPTDYIVALMIRQGLLQELDKSKLPILDQLDPNYLNLSFDPENKYTLPYQAGTDAIIVNTDVVETRRNHSLICGIRSMPGAWSCSTTRAPSLA
jgi:spermidine/putrescine-binding protein